MNSIDLSLEFQICLETEIFLFLVFFMVLLNIIFMVKRLNI